MSVASSQSERVGAGKVSSIVNRLSKDLTKQPGALADVNLRAKPTGQKVVVRYSYNGSHEDELDLKEGDEIEVMETVEDGWMRGRLNGRIGVFPTNFVSFSAAATSTTSPKSSEEKKRSNSVSSNATPAAVPNESVAPPAPTAAPAGDRSYPTKLEDSELMSFVKGGGVRSKSSIFSDSDLTTTVKPLPPTSEPPKIKEMAKVMYMYKAQHEDELDLPQEGLMITIINKNCADPGWYEGELNGKRGLFPDNFVKLVEVPVERPTVAPPMLPTKPKPQLLPKDVIKSESSAPSDPTSNVRRSLYNPSTSQSDNFQKVHSTIANQLKISLPGSTPSKFPLKPHASESSSSTPATAESTPPVFRHTEDKAEDATKLQHLTTNRPKQQKRPPSMFGGARKSDDTYDVPETNDSGTEAKEKENEPKHVTISADKAVTVNEKILLPVKAPASPASSSNEGYVSRREYNELLKAFEELSKRVALLEQQRSS